MAGVDLKTVRELLGHADLAMQKLERAEEIFNKSSQEMIDLVRQYSADIRRGSEQDFAETPENGGIEFGMPIEQVVI